MRKMYSSWLKPPLDWNTWKYFCIKIINEFMNIAKKTTKKQEQKLLDCEAVSEYNFFFYVMTEAKLYSNTKKDIRSHNFLHELRNTSLNYCKLGIILACDFLYVGTYRDWKKPALIDFSDLQLSTCSRCVDLPAVWIQKGQCGNMQYLVRVKSHPLKQLINWATKNLSTTTKKIQLERCTVFGYGGHKRCKRSRPV